ncbi:hypothetical protein ACHAXT_005086 [Thalassiosira profunda]
MIVCAPLPALLSLLIAGAAAASAPRASSTASNWDAADPELDPTRGGKIRPGTPRGERKRIQAEAFVHVVSEMMKSGDDSMKERGTTIVDAGCGGGNLALPLAAFGGPPGWDVEVLAVDVNEFALARLDERAERARASSDRGNCAKIRTLRADLADAAAISAAIPAGRDVVVASLHGCGASSDYAIELAHSLGAPFVVCPCCTAKSLTRRDDDSSNSSDGSTMGASVRRSGANADITYPRSQWLRDALSPDPASWDEYALLARTADVGLGPQTPSRQREHRRRAKRIVELDRLAHSSERYGYETRLVRMAGHDRRSTGRARCCWGRGRARPLQL